MTAESFNETSSTQSFGATNAQARIRTGEAPLLGHLSAFGYVLESTCHGDKDLVADFVHMPTPSRTIFRWIRWNRRQISKGSCCPQPRTKATDLRESCHLSNLVSL